MTGARSGAVVAVEILVEQNVVAQVRIVLERLGVSRVKIRLSRSEISLLTSKRFIIYLTRRSTRS